MHTNPLCMVGDPEDLTAVYVGWRARQRGLEVLELREDRLGLDWGFDYDDAWPDRGWLEIGERGYNFADLAGAFVRLHPEPEVPDELGLDADTRAASDALQAHGGVAVVVASEPREAGADCRLESPACVRAWLAHIPERLATQS